MSDRIVRLSINVHAEQANALRRLADERGTSITEIVRRAVHVYQFLEAETSDGREIRTCDAMGDEVVRIVLL